jgi:hypothetical protein
VEELEQEEPAPEVEEVVQEAAPEPATEPEPEPEPEPQGPTPEEIKAVEDEQKRVAEEAAAKEVFTEEEQEIVDKAREDFPDVTQAMEAQLRTLTAKMENRFNARLQELTEQFTQRLMPTEAVVQRVARNDHEKAILDVHPDAFDIIGTVNKWVSEKPKFLQDSYNEVLKGGSSQAVVDLLNIYKAETAPPPAPAKDPVQDDEKEKKLVAQEGVRSRRTGERASVDPDDFDGAFEKFAATA